jgi:hypothetical protein
VLFGSLYESEKVFRCFEVWYNLVPRPNIQEKEKKLKSKRGDCLMGWQCCSYGMAMLFLRVKRRADSQVDTDVSEKTYCLHLKGLSSPWWWRQKTPLKRRSVFTRLHGATFHKTAMFILAAQTMLCIVVFKVKVKMEAISYSETLISTYKPTWRHRPEGHYRYFHCLENVKSHNLRK